MFAALGVERVFCIALQQRGASAEAYLDSFCKDFCDWVRYRPPGPRLGLADGIGVPSSIEPPLVGILEQRSKLLAVLGAFAAAFMVDVFVHELVASAGAPLPQLPQLVLGVLAFVVGADAGVDSYAHLAALRLRD